MEDNKLALVPFKIMYKIQMASIRLISMNVDFAEVVEKDSVLNLTKFTIIEDS